MKAHIFLKSCDCKPGDEKLLAVVSNLEVCPRGIYVIDDEPYQCTGQPTFIIAKDDNPYGNGHVLKRVEIMVEKTRL